MSGIHKVPVLLSSSITGTPPAITTDVGRGPNSAGIHFYGNARLECRICVHKVSGCQRVEGVKEGTLIKRWMKD